MDTKSYDLDKLLSRLDQLRAAKETHEINTGDEIMALLDDRGLGDCVRARIKREMSSPDQPHDAKICSHIDCNRPVRANGLCGMHEKRKSRGSDMYKPARPWTKKSKQKKSAPTKRTCTWPGCDRMIDSMGLCKAHYNRKRRGTDMDAPIRKRRTTAEMKEKRFQDIETKKSASIGNPVELSVTVTDIKDHRQFDCPALGNCKEYAKAKGWKRFSCNACTGPGKQKCGNKGRGRHA